ncbi:MAG: hypothetical protein V4642_07340 [Bacteroidota bacterium]
MGEYCWHFVFKTSFKTVILNVAKNLRQKFAFVIPTKERFPTSGNDNYTKVFNREVRYFHLKTQ